MKQSGSVRAFIVLTPTQPSEISSWPRERSFIPLPIYYNDGIN